MKSRPFDGCNPRACKVDPSRTIELSAASEKVSAQYSPEEHMTHLAGQIYTWIVFDKINIVLDRYQISVMIKNENQI